MEIIHSTDKCECIMTNNISELNSIVEAVEELAVDWSLSKKLKGQLNLVVEEIVSNIMKYAYSDGQQHVISVEFCKDDACIELKITDDGKKFNMLEFEEKPDIMASVEDRNIGGLGIHIVTTLMDTVDYKRANGKNILLLTKNF